MWVVSNISSEQGQWSIIEQILCIGMFYSSLIQPRTAFSESGSLALLKFYQSGWLTFSLFVLLQKQWGQSRFVSNWFFWSTKKTPTIFIFLKWNPLKLGSEKQISNSGKVHQPPSHVCLHLLSKQCNRHFKLFSRLPDLSTTTPTQPEPVRTRGPFKSPGVPQMQSSTKQCAILFRILINIVL